MLAASAGAPSRPPRWPGRPAGLRPPVACAAGGPGAGLRRRRPDQRRQLRARRRGHRGRQPALDRDRPRRRGADLCALDGLIASRLFRSRPYRPGRRLRAGAAWPSEPSSTDPGAVVLGIGLARGRNRRRPAGRDLRLQPARVDRLGQRDGAIGNRQRAPILRLWARSRRSARWPPWSATRSPTRPRGAQRRRSTGPPPAPCW